MELDIRPGEFIMRNLFADFTVLAEKKIEFVITEPQVKFSNLANIINIKYFILGKIFGKNFTKR